MTLRILSGGAANGLVESVRSRFVAATGLEIEGDYGAVGAMRERIAQGEAVDLVILTRAIVEDLARKEFVDPRTVADLGEVVTGVAVMQGAPKPDLSTEEALRTTISRASALHVPDTVKATAGIHVARTLASLGLRSSIGERLREYPNGQTAMAALAGSGDALALGCTQITEILNTPGVDYVGPLPPPHGLSTIYTAAIAARSTQRDGARTLLEILIAPETGPERLRAGFLS